MPASLRSRAAWPGRVARRGLGGGLVASVSNAESRPAAASRLRNCDRSSELQDRSFARATSAAANSYPPERRLSGRRLAEYLDRRAFAVIGSRRADGRPHAAMASFVRRGATFWLPTVAGSARERNVRCEPWLAMTVTEGDREAHIVVLIEGPAEVVPLTQVPDDVRAAIPADWVAVWIRIAAERVLSYASEGAL